MAVIMWMRACVLPTALSCYIPSLMARLTAIAMVSLLTTLNTSLSLFLFLFYSDFWVIRYIRTLWIHTIGTNYFHESYLPPREVDKVLKHGVNKKDGLNVRLAYFSGRIKFLVPRIDWQHPQYGNYDFKKESLWIRNYLSIEFGANKHSWTFLDTIC